jgi:hypothetical protein
MADQGSEMRPLEDWVANASGRGMLIEKQPSLPSLMPSISVPRSKSR